MQDAGRDDPGSLRVSATRRDPLAEATEALAPYGFDVEHRGATALSAWLPLGIFAQPDTLGPAAFGRIEASTVSAFHYSYSYTDADGQWHTADELLIVAQHPMIRGDARISPDAKEWGGVAAFIDAFLWIPPFTLIKAVQLLVASANPDRLVGDADFDRLYRIHAASDAEARAAIPAALRTMLLKLRFRGRIELRRGALLYAVDGATRFERETLIRVLGYAAPLVSAALEPGNAYR